MRNIGNEEEMAIDTIVYSLIWIMSDTNSRQKRASGTQPWSKSLE
jgi:hypothetical protein